MITTFLRDDGRIAIVAPFAMKDAIKALPGRLWDPALRHWHLPGTPAAAAALVMLTSRRPRPKDR